MNGLFLENGRNAGRIRHFENEADKNGSKSD